MSIGVVLIIAAVAIFFRRRIRDYALARADNPTRTRYSGPITVVFGVVLGVLVSVCSVGAGALGVAVLLFLYPLLRLVAQSFLEPAPGLDNYVEVVTDPLTARVPSPAPVVAEPPT